MMTDELEILEPLDWLAVAAYVVGQVDLSDPTIIHLHKRTGEGARVRSNVVA